MQGFAHLQRPSWCVHQTSQGVRNAGLTRWGAGRVRERTAMPKTMLAVVKPEAKPGAEIREVPIPQFGPTDVLVKVKAASVCGTDLHIYNWDPWAQHRI